MTGTTPGLNYGSLGWSLRLSQPHFFNEAKRMTIPTSSEDEISAFIIDIISEHQAMFQALC